MSSRIAKAARSQASVVMSIAFQHYRCGLRDKLFRYKQLVVVVALLLFPTLGALYGFTVAPLKVLFAPATSSQVLAALLCYQLLAIFWAHLQRDALFHEPVAPFLTSLPIHPSVRLLRDGMLLLVSTIILFVPVGIAYAQHVAASGFDLPSPLMLLYVVTSLTCAQLAYLYRWYPGSVHVVVSTLLVAVAATHASAWPGIPAAYLLLAWVVWRLYFARAASALRGRSTQRSAVAARAAPRSALLAITQLNLHSLREGKASGYRLTLAMALGLAAIAAAVIYTKDAGAQQQSVAGTTSTLVALAAFIFSMSYGTLLVGRRHYAGMLSSLPVSSMQWALFDIVSVQVIPMGMALLLSAIWCWRSSPGSLALVPATTVAALGSVNYLIYKRVPRHAIALSLLALVAGLVIIILAASLIGESGDR